MRDPGGCVDAGVADGDRLLAFGELRPADDRRAAARGACLRREDGRGAPQARIDVGGLGTCGDHGAARDTDTLAFHALYDDLDRTIYLPDDWTAASPAQVSLLVHELVHHLQNVGALRHDCAAERERVAYQAQARWLELVGTSLEEAFGIDPMTLLVRTSCMH